ncbi:hypothetical protein [Geothrix terrae]|uniref:hypothetical protein n=1 Tax=Geothrix terrae TaxID=2922720 RepID=UPI001FAE715D|nr:hypothetical protein [Geothrix terrae]
MSLRTRSRLLGLLFPFLALAVVSCGGGGGGSAPQPAGPATRLHYANPVSSGFRLEADPTTNDTSHLVLNLMGPAGTPAQGVAVFLTCDGTRASWGAPGGTDPHAKAGTALTLGVVPLFTSRQPQGTDDLQVGLFQTGAPPATLGSTPILSVALDLKTGCLSGSRISLVPTDQKTSQYLDGQGVKRPLVLAVGTLTAQ